MRSLKNRGSGFKEIVLKAYALIDGWKRFMSFSTVFKSYQDDGRVIIKGCV